MTHRFTSPSCLIVCLIGCSPTSTGSSTVDGTILGMTLAVRSSLSYHTPNSSTVVLGSFANGCALGPHVTPMSSQALGFVFSQAGAGGPLSGPGTFTVGNTLAPGVVTVTFVGNDNHCVVTSADTGATGTVTVTEASGSGIDGNFDVTLASGSHVSGTFSAPDCHADDVAGAGGSTCQ